MVSIVMAWMTIYQKMPYIVSWRKTADKTAENDVERPDSDGNTKDAPLFQSQKNMVWCLPAMSLSIVPRILNLTFFCGAFMVSSGAPEDCLKPSSNLHLGYAICFSALAGLAAIYAAALGLFYRVRFNFSQSRKQLLLNMATGILGPCIVANPESGLMAFTSVTATLVHLALCVLPRVLWTIDPSLMTRPHDDARMLLTAWLLMLSLLSTWILDFMSYEYNRQWFGLHTRILGSLVCPKEEALLWAAERNHHKLLRLCSNKEQREKTNAYGLNAFALACEKGRLKIQSLHRESAFSQTQ